jgi:mannose/fructose/N-acetylgalactosamine-specific phosphotransferase system component IIB
MSKKQPKVKIIQKENVEEVAPEILAQSIVDVAKAMEAFNKSRLRRETIITLIHAHSKVPKGQIELVLNNLDALERLWLKPIIK